MSVHSSSSRPDAAWDDDWEQQADKLATEPSPPPDSAPTLEKKVSSKVTKAQRRAQQAEFNRQLWAEAESPQTFHFLETRSDVPLKQDIKPAVTLLSRNPPPLVTRQSSSRAVDAATDGVGRMGLGVDDDSEDERPPEPTPEERHAIALKNREEKQRKYEEVRERLFGSPSATTSGASSPRSATPPKQFEGRGKGRSRGGARDNHSVSSGSNSNTNNREKRDQSAASGKSRQLYDPGSPAKSPSNHGPKDRPLTTRNANEAAPQQPYRTPRGPDASGSGGFRSHRGGRGG
ncbi:uncharacterized protein BDW47DRAFT_1081 [Aspergillus candidus]|uniref:Uncharacterized protein n=1 Tax=Aspergillus candidus TaxID=41067 RepID=A0A2I2FPA3_ASPCN|nr:hypothetical protein BDW47DRAFT_1081 [Aspergillus candidus]PLB42458.1 hypothetical protein BDW47DRAFT_1081 [Aspergillus candidus]